MKTIVGFVGTKGSGKTTAKNIMKEYASVLGYNVVELSFSTLLKQFCADITGKHIDHFNNPETKDSLNLSVITSNDEHILVRPRNIMTEIAKTVRSIHKNAFVNYTINYINNYENPPEFDCALFIIDDIRQENEFKAIEDLNGTLIFMNQDAETLYQKIRRNIRLNGPLILRNTNPTEYGLNHLYDKTHHFSIDNTDKSCYNNLTETIKAIVSSDFDLYLYNTRRK